VWYFAWLVIKAESLGLSLRTIEQNFCITGHTKMFCDGCFGLIRRECKSREITSAQRLFEAVNDSSRVNTAVCGTTVEWFEFKLFLEQFFDKTVTCLMKMHHFQYKTANPGVVWHKAAANDPWICTELFKPNITVAHILNPEDYGLRSLKAFPKVNQAMTDARKQTLAKMAESYAPNPLLDTQEKRISNHPFFKPCIHTLE
jgi:hypothetical protein